MDKKEALKIVQENGFELKNLPIQFKKDRMIVQAAVTQHGSALKYADDSLKKDKEIVLLAVKSFGLALSCADESLKKDKEIVLEAVKQGELEVIDYCADESLRKDREFFLEAVKINGWALDYANNDDWTEEEYKEIVLEAVKDNFDAIHSIAEPYEYLKDDPDILKAANLSEPLSKYEIEQSIILSNKKKK